MKRRVSPRRSSGNLTPRSVDWVLTTKHGSIDFAHSTVERLLGVISHNFAVLEKDPIRYKLDQPVRSQLPDLFIRSFTAAGASAPAKTAQSLDGPSTPSSSHQC